MTMEVEGVAPPAGARDDGLIARARRGDRLVFSGVGPGDSVTPGMDQSTPIYVINADGTGRRWLAEGEFPAWSPAARGPG